MHTVVINNCRRLEICQLPSKSKDAMKNGIPGGTIMLLPGVNLVPSADHADAMKNEIWKAKFTTTIQRSLAPEQDPETVGRPMLEIPKWIGDKGGGEVEESKPLAKLSPETCQRLVNETWNSDLLKAWAKQELRPDILRAIGDQIERLRTGELASAATVGR